MSDAADVSYDTDLYYAGVITDMVIAGNCLFDDVRADVGHVMGVMHVAGEGRQL